LLQVYFVDKIIWGMPVLSNLESTGYKGILLNMPELITLDSNTKAVTCDMSGPTDGEANNLPGERKKGIEEDYMEDPELSYLMVQFGQVQWVP
jgi:hypothetical protein